MVTAEAALAVASLTVVVGLLLQVFVLVFAELRAGDAARRAARAVARGEGALAGDLAARELAGARVRVEQEGDLVRVEVRAEVPLPLLGLRRTVVATAAADLEPGVVP